MHGLWHRGCLQVSQRSPSFTMYHAAAATASHAFVGDSHRQFPTLVAMPERCCRLSPLCRLRHYEHGQPEGGAHLPAQVWRRCRRLGRRTRRGDHDPWDDPAGQAIAVVGAAGCQCAHCHARARRCRWHCGSRRPRTAVRTGAAQQNVVRISRVPVLSASDAGHACLVLGTALCQAYKCVCRA